MSGLYIHIPFCASRCIYCDFFSTTRIEQISRYVDCLCRELELRKSTDVDLFTSGLSSIYIGGGTPSQLPVSQLEKLFDCIYGCFDLSQCSEVTIECNPEDIDFRYISSLRSLPINRMSFGIQTFDDSRLRFLHRRHNGNQAKRAVRLSQESGYDNISIDLMFGFPGESVSSWEKDIDNALYLDVQHISAYSLMYSEGTALTKLVDSGSIKELADEEIDLMYNLLSSKLCDAGYEHYEISNFSRRGFRSLHNSSYWQGVPYIGIGAGAHSYNGSCRMSNPNSLDKYIDSIEKGNLCLEKEYLSADDRYNEYVMTRLRMLDGIDKHEFSRLFSKEYTDYFAKMSEPHKENGNLEEKNDRIHINESRFFISNSIISDLFKV